MPPSDAPLPLRGRLELQLDGLAWGGADDPQSWPPPLMCAGCYQVIPDEGVALVLFIKSARHPWFKHGRHAVFCVSCQRNLFDDKT